jgi:hypothetical protein
MDEAVQPVNWVIWCIGTPHSRRAIHWTRIPRSCSFPVSVLHTIVEGLRVEVEGRRW